MNVLNRFGIFLLCSLAIAGAETFEVTVVGDRVNLRNAPSLESKVIGSADYGDTYTAKVARDKWVELEMPETFEVWAYASLLFEDSEVKALVMNLRSGPGTQFAILGQLSRGDKVDVLETKGDWRRIAVPETSSVWISRKFVQLPPQQQVPMDPEPTAEPTPAPVAEATPEPLSEPTPEPSGEPTPEPTVVPEGQPTPEATPEPVKEPTIKPTPEPTPLPVVEIQTVEKIIEVPVVPTPTPTVVPPVELKLVPLQGQGTYSIRRGRVKVYLLAASSPSRFMLVRVDADGRETSLAYLLGAEEKLRALSGRAVKVTGRDFWVSGQRLPATEVESVEPLEMETP